MDKKEELKPTENINNFLDAGNPTQITTFYQMGGTIYEVEVSCQGSETLRNKMLRLLKTENIST